MAKEILTSVEIDGDLDVTGNITAEGVVAGDSVEGATRVLAYPGGDIYIEAASGDNHTSLANHEIMIWMGLG